MTRQCDGVKRREWEQRLARQRASGLSVARFCATEGVSVNTYYYWARRVSAPAGQRARSPQAEAKRSGGWSTEGADSKSFAVAAAPMSSSAAVRFQFAANVTVWVPAECMEVIRCLAECAQHAAAASERAPLGAFREVVIGAPRARS